MRNLENYENKLFISALLTIALCFYSCEKTSSDDQTTNASSDEKTNPDDKTENGSNDDETIELPELPELEDVDDVCTKMKDINFMAYCYDSFDVNHDGKVSMTEAAAVSTISCSTASDFTGIEYFSGLKSFTSNSVKTIDLRYNTELTSIEFSYSKVKQIDLRYNKNLTSLEREAFRDCTSLTSISLPSSMVEIGDYVFQGCTGLASISSLSDLTYIGAGAFAGCSGLTTIELPSNLTYIATYLFYGCWGLTSISLPIGLTGIHDSAFRKCTGLVSISLPTSLTYIEYCAFSECAALTAIDLPFSITEIGSGAFSECGSLNSVLSNAITPPTLSHYVFDEIDDSAILYVPSESVTAYKNSDWSDYFTEILPL